MPLAQTSRQIEELSLAGFGLSAAGTVGDQLIRPGHARIDRLNIASQQKTDLGAWKEVANGPQRRRGHHGIAYPIRLHDQDALRAGH